VHYSYIPGFGFYAFGLIHLIGAAAKSSTMLLRQLVDAGTLSNLPGGFKTRGLRIKGDDTPIAPAEFRDVDVPSGAIRDNIMPLPYKEPSQVLQSLMNGIIEEAKSFANAADMKVSDMSANSPVGTTLAILERTLKVMSAVQARVHYAMKQEFKLIAGIIRDYTPEDYSYEPVEGSARAKQSDYDMVEVIPVSDPNAATMSQKVVQYQAVMQMAQQNPDIYDLVELNKQMLEVLGVRNIGKLIPAAEDEKPRDPVTENMNVINGKPVKAFLYQDHEAHLSVHQSAIQDPQIMELMGQNPKAQAIQAAMAAHINEHIAFAYRQKIEEQLGVPLPDPEEQLPKEAEYQLAPLIAKAAQQLLQQHQGEAQQKQAEQQAQDPVVQMQQKELELKEQEIQAKGMKMQAEDQNDKERLAIERERIASAERIAQMNLEAKQQAEAMKAEKDQTIVGAKLGADYAFKNKKLEADQQAKGIDIGMKAVENQAARSLKDKEQEHKKEMAAKQHNLSMNQLMQQKKTPKEE
jgi:hypothetical protein